MKIPIGGDIFGGKELPYVLSQIEYKGKPVYCFPDRRKDSIDPKKRSKESTYYKRLLERVSEIEGLPELSGKSFHCLRHSFVSRLKKHGKTLEEIGKLVGHSSTETTQGYVHS